jgi:wyosine [tRNA(Phe)-imidazoG37] synthetase (radical SAM superfamily)
MGSYVFGPVPSRRLGLSLGVDLVPFKTCTFDCIYCQLGPTTCKTTRRSEWVPLDAVLRDVEANLEKAPDFITLSGSGEPTLYSRLEELIGGIKRLTDVPVAVLTNGSLLWRPEVRTALAAADLVAPSLDAGDAHLFRHVNRPHDEITFDRLVEGLVRLREEYKGRYWLEVFLLGGVTALPAEVEKIGRLVAQIAPDRVQVNTVTRPPAEPYAFRVPPAELAEFAAMLGDRAEVIAEHRPSAETADFAAHAEDIVALLRRRPCTMEDIAQGLRLHRNEAVKCVNELLAHNVLEIRWRGRTPYYRAIAGAPDSGGSHDDLS